MPLSLYQTIKSAITVRQVGEMYGMEPDRHGMVCCPFHSDNHPSMMLNESYYYCFACGANGDAIDLTAKLFDLTPRQAAEKLASDFGLDPDKPPPRTFFSGASWASAIRRDTKKCGICEKLRLTFVREVFILEPSRFFIRIGANIMNRNYYFAYAYYFTMTI